MSKSSHRHSDLDCYFFFFLPTDPSATGPPISIGWQYECLPRVTVEEFERWKGKSVKTRKDLYLSEKKRRQLLRGIPVPPSPLEVQRVQQEAEYIQYCRERVRSAEKKRQFRQRVAQQRACSPVAFSSPTTSPPPPLYSDSDSCSSMDQQGSNRNGSHHNRRPSMIRENVSDCRWTNGEAEWEESLLNTSMMIHDDSDDDDDDDSTDSSSSVFLGQNNNNNNNNNTDCRQPDDSDTSQPVSRQRRMIQRVVTVVETESSNHRATPVPVQWMDDADEPQRVSILSGFASDVEQE